jgi:ABC-2 type transport system permease protein
MSGVLNRTVMWVTLRQLFVRQRLITAIVVMLVPLTITFFFLAARERPDMMAGRFLMNMYRELVVGTILPLTAIVYGTSAFGAEVNDGTIVYLLVKPEARWRVVLSKLLVAAMATIVTMVPTVFLPWMLLNHEVVPISVPTIVAAGISVGALLYAALFIALGLYSKRALVFGLLYIVLIEFVLSRSAAGTKSFSIREFILTATARIGEGNRWIGAGEVSIETVYSMGTIIFFGCLLYAWQRYKRFEMAEKL